MVIMVAMKKSEIAHPHTRQRVFPVRTVGKGRMAGYYYGSLVYVDFSSSGSRFETYEENVLKVTVETFVKCVSRFSKTTPDRNMK